MIKKEGMSVLWEIIHLALPNKWFCEPLRVQYQHSAKSSIASFTNMYPTSDAAKINSGTSTFTSNMPLLHSDHKLWSLL